MKKILCFVLIYSEVNIITRCMKFLTKHSNRLDIVIIENNSKQTDSIISPLIHQYLNDKKVVKYYLMKQNIINNAFLLVLNLEKNNLLQSENYDKVIITDGDLDVENDNWIDEQITILDSDLKIFTCATSLDMINLPLTTFPDSISWIPDPIATTELY